MKSALGVLLLILACGRGATAQNLTASNACSASLPAPRKSELVDYVRKEYGLPDSISLDLASDEPVEDSCYRRLTFRGKSAIKTWDLTMYLSPDRRFLSSDLFDSRLDPAEEERRRRETAIVGVAQNKGNSKGRDDAPVTLIEFSDFQCPYCRTFAAVLDEALIAESGGVRVVFHHLPLSMHVWARKAAEGAACAQMQGPDAFWSIHDQLFQNQRQITAENVTSRLLEFARNSRSVDAAAFESCLRNQMSLGPVFRDMDLAAATGVNGTPTAFINGMRAPGIKDTTQLRKLISDATGGSSPDSGGGRGWQQPSGSKLSSASKREIGGLRRSQ